MLSLRTGISDAGGTLHFRTHQNVRGAPEIPDQTRQGSHRLPDRQGGSDQKSGASSWRWQLDRPERWKTFLVRRASRSRPLRRGPDHSSTPTSSASGIKAQEHFLLRPGRCPVPEPGYRRLQHRHADHCASGVYGQLQQGKSGRQDRHSPPVARYIDFSRSRFTNRSQR